MQVQPSPNRAGDDDLSAVLQGLYVRSEPLIRRRRLYNWGANTRQKFLVVRDSRTSHLASLALERGFTLVGGGGASYLAALQVARGIAVNELLVLPRLREAYDRLPADTRDQVHLKPDWVNLPELNRH